MNRVMCVLAVLLCIACGYAMAASAAEIKENKDILVPGKRDGEEAGNEVEVPPESAEPPTDKGETGETGTTGGEETEEEEGEGEDAGTDDDGTTEEEQPPNVEDEENNGTDGDQGNTDQPGKPEGETTPAPEKPEETPSEDPETQEPTSTNAPSNEQKPGDADSSFSPVWMRTAAPLLIVA
ncbi:uncharacterized protein TM35_000112090, partial [Trypanosoma theileri]